MCYGMFMKVKGQFAGVQMSSPSIYLVISLTKFFNHLKMCVAISPWGSCRRPSVRLIHKMKNHCVSIFGSFPCLFCSVIWWKKQCDRIWLYNLSKTEEVKMRIHVCLPLLPCLIFYFSLECQSLPKAAEQERALGSWVIIQQRSRGSAKTHLSMSKFLLL